MERSSQCNESDIISDQVEWQQEVLDEQEGGIQSPTECDPEDEQHICNPKSKRIEQKSENVNQFSIEPSPVLLTTGTGSASIFLPGWRWDHDAEANGLSVARQSSCGLELSVQLDRSEATNAYTAIPHLQYRRSISSEIYCGEDDMTRLSYEPKVGETLVVSPLSSESGGFIYCNGVNSMVVTETNIRAITKSIKK